MQGAFFVCKEVFPIASRNASSEVYLVCKNKKPNGSIGESSPIAEITTGLEEIGVLSTEQEDPEETVVGFRRL